jgi:hypothetical protein
MKRPTAVGAFLLCFPAKLRCLLKIEGKVRKEGKEVSLHVVRIISLLSQCSRSGFDRSYFFSIILGLVPAFFTIEVEELILLHVDRIAIPLSQWTFSPSLLLDLCYFIKFRYMLLSENEDVYSLSSIKLVLVHHVENHKEQKVPSS